MLRAVPPAPPRGDDAAPAPVPSGGGPAAGAGQLRPERHAALTCAPHPALACRPATTLDSHPRHPAVDVADYPSRTRLVRARRWSSWYSSAARWLASTTLLTSSRPIGGRSQVSVGREPGRGQHDRWLQHAEFVLLAATSQNPECLSGDDLGEIGPRVLYLCMGNRLPAKVTVLENMFGGPRPTRGFRRRSRTAAVGVGRIALRNHCSVTSARTAKRRWRCESRTWRTGSHLPCPQLRGGRRCTAAARCHLAGPPGSRHRVGRG